MLWRVSNVCNNDQEHPLVTISPAKRTWGLLLIGFQPFSRVTLCWKGSWLFLYIMSETLCVGAFVKRLHCPGILSSLLKCDAFYRLASVLLPLIKALFILNVAFSFDVSPPYPFEIIKGVEKYILDCTLNKQSSQGGISAVKMLVPPIITVLKDEWLCIASFQMSLWTGLMIALAIMVWL